MPGPASTATIPCGIFCAITEDRLVNIEITVTNMIFFILFFPCFTEVIIFE